MSAPASLKGKQEWFASIITRPIDDHSCINPIAPSGASIEQEATKYIAPSPTLCSHQRIELYNQQYWWRLLSTLHEAFPLVVRMFGYSAFNNKIGTPYIVKYPSQHWSLGLLGSRLPQWADEEYHEEDRQLVNDAIAIDWAFNASFIAGELPPITLEDLDQGEKLLDLPLTLQPHIHLFKLNYNMFAARRDFLKEEVEHWAINPFPDLPRKKTYHFILYRDTHNQVGWKSLAPAEYALLKQFETPCSITSALKWLETQHEEAEKGLQGWFQRWIRHGWLACQH